MTVPRLTVAARVEVTQKGGAKGGDRTGARAERHSPSRTGGLVLERGPFSLPHPPPPFRPHTPPVHMRWRTPNGQRGPLGAFSFVFPLRNPPPPPPPARPPVLYIVHIVPARPPTVGVIADHRRLMGYCRLLTTHRCRITANRRRLAANLQTTDPRGSLFPSSKFLRMAQGPKLTQ